jgi:AFG3 family protein
MENNKPKNTDNNKAPQNGPKIKPFWIYAGLAFLIIILNVLLMDSGQKELTEVGFRDKAQANEILEVKIIKNKEFAYITLTEEAAKKDFSGEESPKVQYKSSNYHYKYTFGSLENFEKKIDNYNQELKRRDNSEIIITYGNEVNIFENFGWLLPILILVLIWVFLFRRMGGGGAGPGSQIFNIGKSKATLFDQGAKVNVTFSDVAGLDEAKEEVMEIVDFLKHPKKYTALGGKIPKGVLLVGEPGTGKTLMAKAVAGEAEVPFFTISGSDFVEMFVGVGASRVRDLFKQAREKAPCIIFIDEIDAIGRARGRNNMQGSNDERENTLNQLLVEMDGFATDKAVIIMAATNRPDVLDSALLRPGRFDRQIGIDRPDLKGRTAIFSVHLNNIKTAEGIKAEQLAEMTSGFAGADIANICNEAALVAARRNKGSVDLDDFNHALDRVIGGLEKKNKFISKNEKEIIAYHEAGHAICGWFLEHASPLVKVTIVPRGIGTLGYAQYMPKEEYITRKEQLLDRMCMTFGGRAAEQNMFGKISTGAQNDLDQITKMGYSMISYFGMNNEVGQVSFYGLTNGQWQKPYSDQTAAMIDTEVRKLAAQQYQRAQDLLKDKSKELEILAKALLEREVLLKEDVERLIGPRPFSDVYQEEEGSEEKEQSITE